MDHVNHLHNLIEAIKLLKTARVELAGGSFAIWNKVDNAVLYLDKQIAALLTEN